MRPYDKYVLGAVGVVGVVAVLLAVLPAPKLPRFPGDPGDDGRVVLPDDLHVVDSDTNERAREWIKDNPTPENIAHLVAALDEDFSVWGPDSAALTLREMGEPAKYMVYTSLRDICVERMSAAKSEGWEWLELDSAIGIRLCALPDEDPILVRLPEIGVRGVWHVKLGYDGGIRAITRKKFGYDGAITATTRKKAVETILKIIRQSLPDLESRVLGLQGKRPTTGRGKDD